MIIFIRAGLKTFNTFDEIIDILASITDTISAFYAVDPT